MAWVLHGSQPSHPKKWGDVAATHNSIHNGQSSRPRNPFLMRDDLRKKVEKTWIFDDLRETRYMGLFNGSDSLVTHPLVVFWRFYSHSKRHTAVIQSPGSNLQADEKGIAMV
jgi:hypothetical protein